MSSFAQRRPPRASRGRQCALLAAALLVLGAPAARAQAPGQGGAPGVVGGQVFDRETGDPVPGVTVILLWPDSGDGGSPRQEVQTTDGDGAYRFPSVPAGSYSLSFVKSGYRAAKMTHFAVEAGKLNRADFPIQPTPPETAEGVLELEAFVVEAETVEDIMSELELRMDSDQLLNIMSAEDFSKFAASDVADALKRVAGVNVVEGQFAIIRGLEDRYSSTLYNSAPVPSPDPDSQSVQLDLFPADIVSNLIVSKTFAPDLPSNSAGGAIDIVTHDYPESFEFKVTGGSGFNDNAVPRFIDFVSQSSVGDETDGSDVVESEYGALIGGRKELLRRELRFKALVNREIDYETKEGVEEKREPGVRPPFDPVPGCQNGIFVPGVGFVCLDDDFIFFPTDLQQGELGLTGGRFDVTESSREEQLTGYVGFGLDLDAEGDHRIDASGFYTRKEEESVEFKENGYLPDFDYGSLDPFNVDSNSNFDGVATLGSWIARDLREDVRNSPARGPFPFAAFFESRSFERERDLLVYQVNGDHRFDRWVEGLRLTWAANQAETTQSETFFGTRYYFEPTDPEAVALDPPTTFPIQVEDLQGDGPLCPPIGPGVASPFLNCFLANDGILFSRNEVEEEQDFARLDAEYEIDLFDWLTVTLKSGGWYEQATRGVDAIFLESPNVGGESQFAVSGESPGELGARIYAECDDDHCLDRDPAGNFQFTRQNTSDAEREIWAWHLGAKATLWDRLDLLAGVRREEIVITSLNDPFQFNQFTGEPEFQFGVQQIFPSRFLFFDRLDNPDHLEEISPAIVPGEGFVFNDEILGIDIEPNVPCPTPDRPDRMCVDLTEDELRAAVNGRIDESFWLPSYGFTLRPLEGLTLRGAYSRTVARPSFRELGYYVSVEPGTDDQVVGNPQLGLSRVESWDARAEYTWGDLGDLLAVSVFKKSIEDPIERIVLRDQADFENTSGALFRTYFNNPNQASLRGFEVEGRKNLGFLTLDFLNREIPGLGFLKHLDFLRYLSVGGNYTWIDAEVGRTEAELARSAAFFQSQAPGPHPFSELAETRRLFSQPEWIVNADITFDHPDWGTKFTLAFFQISDILDSAGTATISSIGETIAFTLDRYVDSFHQLDLIASQTRYVDWLRGDVTFKLSAKNLTDSTRQLIYDPSQTRGEVAERSFKLGRDYSFSISYKFSF